MKVCMISTFPPKRCGIADYTSNLSFALAQRGVEVEIVTYRDLPIPMYEELKPDIEVRRILTKGPLIGLKCWKEIEKISPDIVHVQSSTGLHKRFVYFFVLLNRGRFPVVTTVHDTPASIRLLDYIPFLRLIYRNSESIFVHTRKIKQSLIKYHGVLENKVTIIPHGVDVNLYKPRSCSETIKRSFNLSDDYVILFFGFVRPGKGVEYLVEAMPFVLKEVPRTKLLIAGGLPSETGRYCFYLKSERGYLLSLKRKVDIHNLNKNILFTDYIPGDIVPEFFDLANVAIFPYISCSQSGPMHKALASGKAVITTKVGGVEEIIENGKNGIVVPPKDSIAIAKAVVMLLKDEHLRAELGKQARMTAEKFSWEDVAKATLNVYEQLVSK